MRLMLGHDAPPTNFWRENLLTRAPLPECPVRTMLRYEETRPQLMQELARHISRYAPYERGVLLVAGGLDDQPARYLDFMEVIDRSTQARETRYLELIREEEEKNASRVTSGNGALE
ncbi:MAG TPA: hypothetical protein VH439_17345 [Gemmatimonadales bacterium]|jgi:hypothetical protein